MAVTSARAAAPGGSLVAALTPTGRIEVEAGAPGEGPELAAAVAERIAAAFAAGRGQGVVHLGATELQTLLHPTLAYWRELGRAFIAAVCGALDPLEPDAFVAPEPAPGMLDGFVERVPPMRGGELVTSALLAEIWSSAAEALAVEVQSAGGGVAAYLHARDPVWNVVGRVCLHLAENRADPDYPFAFMATYVYDVTRQGKARYRPLGAALKEYAGARNRAKLRALLAPLARAAQESEWIRGLVESDDVYHPLPWTAAEAHRFLSESAAYERAGLVVRVPDWWSTRKPPRPMVSVSVGAKAPTTLGTDALLDFDVKLTLDGEPLSRTEIDALLSSSEGLILLKGRWVEADREKLGQVLEHWRAVQARAEDEGVSFGEAMRMLAGTPLGRGDAADDARPEWSEVVAGTWLRAKLDALRAPVVRAEIERNAGLTAELRPYQKRGVEWLWTLRSLQLGGCLADDMGLGKTLQVLGVLSMSRRKEEPGTDLLVVPASLLDNWRAEIDRFASGLRVLIAHPSRIPSRELKSLSAEEVDGYDAVLSTYGTVVRTPWMKTHRWRSVILDEAQAIKNPGTQQTRAIKALPSAWRLALTGTPVENRLGDLWSIFDFLNPGLLGSAKAFGRLTKSMADSPEGYAPLRRLVQPYILRRLKTDRRVIDDLPDKTEVNAYCLLSKRQAALYQQSVDEMKKALGARDGIERRGIVLAFLMRFKQICNHPSHWLGDGVYDPNDSGKLERLRELGESIAARQDKVLVFTQFREMTEPLADFLAGVFGRPGLVLHGGTPVRKRQTLVERFQSDDRVPFMVLSLKAGGTGLNLTAASHVVHFDRWWNPAVESQATDRAFRIGQKRNVLVHKLVCRGTVEERIDALIASKEKLSEELLAGGAEVSLTELSDDELLSMVSLDLSRAAAA